MKPLAKALLVFAIVFHLIVFVVEAFLWMNPGVHGAVIRRLSDGVTVDPEVQAAILRRLFVNQGFYNLFLALAGIAGFTLLRRGNPAGGRALLVYMCATAVGAGVVLALSTGAYFGAVLQALPAAIALSLLLRRQPVGWGSGGP
jgi:putative membrane protein